MRKKLVSTAMATIMLLLMLAGCGDTGTKTPVANGGDGAATSGEIRTWKFGHIRPDGTESDLMAREFAETLMNSIDNLQIDVYPNSQLGDYTVMQEAASMNEIELVMASMSTGVDPTLSVQIAPYLVLNWEDANKLYNSTDGAMFQYISERLELQNIKLLAVVPKYFGSIATTKEVQNIEDPTGNKGVKVRVPQQNPFNQFMQDVGFQTTPLPTAEIFTSLQTGVVDGTSGGGTESYWNDFGELVGYVYLMKTHMENHWLYMSLDTWNSLSEEEQKIVKDAAKTLENEAYELAESSEERFDKMFTDRGDVVYVPDDEIIAAYADYVRTNVWPKIGSEYGDIWDTLTAEILGG